jgi:pimeloyl-ACP methyl ester carboxylesterase
VIHTAAEGNYGPLAQAALHFRRNLVATGSNGMYLSITCAEDLPWVKAEDAAKLGANTFLGDYRYRQQNEACALWPRAKIDSKYAQPVRSDKPVLIMTGEWDPVTPPANGDAIAKTLPNSLHGIECLNRVMTEFVERGSVKGLDTTCVKNIKRSGFALKF